MKFFFFKMYSRFILKCMFSRVDNKLWCIEKWDILVIVVNLKDKWNVERI